MACRKLGSRHHRVNEGERKMVKRDACTFRQSHVGQMMGCEVHEETVTG